MCNVITALFQRNNSIKGVNCNFGMSHDCEICGKSYTMKHNLQRHIKMSCNKTTAPEFHLKTDFAFRKMDTEHFECIACGKVVKYCKPHLDRCKGCPKNQCRHCFKTFTHQQSVSRHEKTCSTRKREETLEEPVVQYIELLNQGTINHINNTTNNFNYSINVHGKEDFESLVSLLKEKFRNEMIQVLENNDGDVVFKLAYFNKDFPENQTLKKLKKSDQSLMVHTGLDQWSMRPATEAVRLAAERAAKQLSLSFVEDGLGTKVKDMRNTCYLSEVTHRETVKEPKDTKHILGPYSVSGACHLEAISLTRKLKEIENDIRREFPTFNPSIPLWKKELYKRNHPFILEFEDKWDRTYESMI